ncbi:hypothetical protein AAU61_08830 [Desulfocarbo indianensis]|nr:hypothetical protein AAU61_08830 [Desulfocarbo indianensis]
MARLADMLTRARGPELGRWRKLFWLALLALVAANVFIRPHHAEYGLDAYPGFWGIFGLLVAVLMVLVMKKLVQPVLKRQEDEDHGDD